LSIVWSIFKIHNFSEAEKLQNILYFEYIPDNGQQSMNESLSQGFGESWDAIDDQILNEMHLNWDAGCFSLV
jgi:hypothetical protein